MGSEGDWVTPNVNMFTEEMLKKCNFFWENLDGKTLKIAVGTSTLDGVKSTVVAGYNKENGITYILHSGQENVKG